MEELSMTQARFPPDDPREWLNRARANLVRAGMRAPGVYLEDLCFDAQQAAEKAIKAVLIRRGVEFPHTHDLGRLLALVRDEGESIPDAVEEARELTAYAWLTRYPAEPEPTTCKRKNLDRTLSASEQGGCGGSGGFRGLPHGLERS